MVTEVPLEASGAGITDWGGNGWEVFQEEGKWLHRWPVETGWSELMAPMPGGRQCPQMDLQIPGLRGWNVVGMGSSDGYSDSKTPR